MNSTSDIYFGFYFRVLWMDLLEWLKLGFSTKKLNYIKKYGI